MSGVEFGDERQAMLQKMQSFQNGAQGSASSSKFVTWLMNKGIVKTEAGGQMLLLGIVAFNIIISIAIIVYIL